MGDGLIAQEISFRHGRNHRIPAGRLPAGRDMLFLFITYKNPGALKYRVSTSSGP
jgi:hypothetical protein